MALVVRLALLACVAGVITGSAATASAAPVGQPPPEWSAGGWPGPNHDLMNTRATTQTRIDSRSVSRLAVKWRFPLGEEGLWGSFSTNPVVVDDTVYGQDMSSDVFALDRDTGRVKWQRSFGSLSYGPNGLAYGWGTLYGVTATGVFALDPRNGATRWTRELVAPGGGGIDIAPQLYDSTVIVSTVPLNPAFGGEEPGAMGIVWALDARTGAPGWQFNTVKDADLWGHPEINSGGGLWYPPAVDDKGRVFLGVANPAPWPGTPEYPNGSSRPGPNLYTNSLVALDGKTGRLLWYRQEAPHDLRDADLAISPIVTYLTLGGVRTEVVITAGKMGKVFAYRADDGRPLWQRSLGRHQSDTGPLPESGFATVFPAVVGGAETPMALANGRLFVTWVDLGVDFGAAQILLPDLTTGRGGMAALDPDTGRILWRQSLRQMPFGAATVANDVVFTTLYSGEVYAFEAGTGRLLWRDRARAGINSFPAIDHGSLLIGAGAGPNPFVPPELFPNPLVRELVAYKLPG
jgi:outer membrane protein assembly factor BamB